MSELGALWAGECQKWGHVVMFTIDVGASMGIKGCRSARRTWLYGGGRGRLAPKGIIKS